MGAIEAAGYEPGKDVAIALDPAASEFFQDGCYVFKKSGAGTKTAEEMVALYKGWIDRYPIVSIEDGLAEDDWSGWANLTEPLSPRVQLVADHLFCTNIHRRDPRIEEGVANANRPARQHRSAGRCAIARSSSARSPGWRAPSRPTRPRRSARPESSSE